MNATDPSPSIPDLFEAAMKAHSAADVDEARAGYAQLRELVPLNADAWHLAGVLEGQYGSWPLAESLVRRAIEIDADQAMFHCNLGNIVSRMGRFDDAELAYRRALELSPHHMESSSNLALMTSWRGDADEAERQFLALLERVPYYTPARQNIVSLYLRKDDFLSAIRHAATGLITSPKNIVLRHALGRAYADHGMPDKAIEVYRNWLIDDPDHPQPKHHLAALLNEDIPERASDAYVRNAFEVFARSFDAKLAELEYRAPTLVGESVVEALGAPGKSLRIIDAGCGTGLVSPHLLPYAHHLVGVDLSPEMLERAAERGGYDELVEAELVAFLESRPSTCELLTSADTLCYFGRLDQFAAAARRALTAGGWVVYTVEARDDAPGEPDYKLHHHGRYSHRRGYVEGVLTAAGFVDVTTDAVVLRNENRVPVRGWLARARVPQEG